MMPTIRSTAEKYEALTAYTDFAKAALAIMATDSLGDPAQTAKAAGFSGKICEVLNKKAATGALSTDGSGISGSLGPLLPPFMSQVASAGAFDAIAAAALTVSLSTNHRVVIASSIAASAVNEGAAKPVHSLSFTLSDLTPTKVASTVVLSDELVEGLTDVGVRALARELRRAVALAADSAFLAALTGNSAEAMGADSLDGFSDDLGELLRLVDAGATSRLFLITTPMIGRQLAAKGLTSGLNLSWNGGTVAGIEVRISDAQDAGRMTLVAADGLAIAQTPLELRSSWQAAIQMDNSPSSNTTSPTAVSLVSMLQTNCSALIAERLIGILAVRQNSYAHLSGVALGQGAGSPA